MHSNTTDTTRAAVACFLVKRGRRSRENELPRLIGRIIDGVSYAVPNPRNVLPFVNCMRHVSMKCQFGFFLIDFWIFIHVRKAVGERFRSP